MRGDEILTPIQWLMLQKDNDGSPLLYSAEYTSRGIIVHFDKAKGDRVVDFLSKNWEGSQ